MPGPATPGDATPAPGPSAPGGSTRLGFHVDVRRCTGCFTCVLACEDYRRDATGTPLRRVLEHDSGSWWQDERGRWQQDCRAYYVSVACNHCDRPLCVQACPTGAMHRDGQGLVVVDVAHCVGCGRCEHACPYHAPHVSPTTRRCVKCDGCASRVARGLAPVCVEACPLRALDFGPVDDLRGCWGAQAELPPLPSARATEPRLVITPPAGA